MKRNLIYHTLVPVEQDIEVLAKRNGEHSCRLESISKDGVTLSTDRFTLDKLLPNHASVAPKQCVELDIDFHLMRGQLPIVAQGRLIAVRRLCRDRYELKLTFTSLSEQQQAIIDQFVEDALHGTQQQKVA
ncbi:MAG: PilZ domain-containing protein [Oleiphilaceae bacterium]|nr:PilZ domain-containing protein [Oleiphilaceae bacterium]